MKQLLFFSLFLCSLGLQAQLSGISVETYMIHDGSISGLDGFTTYHVYANTTNPSDFVSAVFGDSENPMGITMSGDIFNSTPGFFTVLRLTPYSSQHSLLSNTIHG